MLWDTIALFHRLHRHSCLAVTLLPVRMSRPSRQRAACSLVCDVGCADKNAALVARRSSPVARGLWLVARRVDCQVATSPGSTRDCCHTNTRPTSIPKACTCTRRFARRERVLFCSGCAFREPRFTIFVIGDSRFAIRGLPFDRRVRLG